MAVARGNAGTISWNAGSNPTYTLPTNSADDIMVLVVQQAGASSAINTPTVSGWTQIATVADGTNFQRLTAFWKRSTGSESTASITIASAGKVNVKAWTYTGCVTTGDPLDPDATAGAATANSTTASAPSVTPSNDNGMVVFIMADSDDSVWDTYANTDPGSLSEWTDENDTAGQDTSIALADGLQTTAAATGAATANKSKAADNHSEMQFVLQEAAGAAAATVSVSNPVVLSLFAQGPTIQAGKRVDVADPAKLTFTAPGPAVQAGAAIFPSSPGVLVFSPRGPTVQTGASVFVADGAGLILVPPGPTLESGASIFADPAGLLLAAPGPTIDIVVPGIAVDVDVSGPAVLQVVSFGPTLQSGATVLARSFAAIDSHSESNQDSTFPLSQFDTGIAQSFTGNGKPLRRARFYLSTADAPTGTLTSHLYAHSGVFGTSSVPTGAALASSRSLSATVLTATPTLYDFDFPAPATPADGTNYCIALELANEAGFDEVQVYRHNTAPTHPGNGAQFTASWSAVSEDYIFYALAEAPPAQLIFRAEWPTLQAGATVFGDVAGILINALNPTIQRGASVAADPASLLFAGQGATIRVGAGVFASPPALTLSAPPPTVQAGASVFAGPQTLVITAEGPTVAIEGGAVNVNVEGPAFFSLVPGDPTVVIGAVSGRKSGVNLGISVGRDSVRDPLRDVGNLDVTEFSED